LSRFHIAVQGFWSGFTGSSSRRGPAERARFWPTNAPTNAPQKPATWEASGPTFARSIPIDTAQNPIRLKPATL
jgi:hypothetical protein